MGVTREGEELVLSYVDEAGELRAERVAPAFFRPLERLLEPE